MPLYGPTALSKLNANIDTVQAWIDANPGNTAQACATALGITVEAVYYAVDALSGYTDLPDTPDQYHRGKHSW